MVVKEQLGKDEEAEPQWLEPFAIAPGMKSKVEGIHDPEGAGAEPQGDIDYVFHTLYVPCPRGAIHFTVRFEGLTATTGVLTLRVNGVSTLMNAPPHTAGLIEVPLRQVVANRGELGITVTTAADHLYAIMGHIYGETDARAEKLASVRVERESVAKRRVAKEFADRRTRFSARMHVAPNLVSPAAPTLAEPVSQVCTRPQFEEPAFAEWTGRLGVPIRLDRGQWQDVFALQSLRRYGLLETAARGLVIGDVGTRAVALLAAAGCEVASIGLLGEGREVPEASAEEARPSPHPELCGDEAFGRQVSHASLTAPDFALHVQEFDFLWSAGTGAAFATVGAHVRFLQDVTNCLKPGGLAVHIVDFDPSPPQSRNADPYPTRRHIDQLALGLISENHEVAQLKYGTESEIVVDAAPAGAIAASSFALIARRGVAPA